MEKDHEIAIKVEHVSKTFKIPHEKVSSVKGAVVRAFSHNKGYEEFKALDDVSFEVKKGEFFGIIGRNGSGKSTLLKILAGIYQADTGSVSISGRISPFLELGIGFNPELSGRDNVYLNATVLGLTKKEIDEKFDSIVKFSELERFIDQKLKNYSSGMQVRLAFSVSIHANRDILLMDEVLAVGDLNFQSKCLEEFNKYRKMGKTIILVSHDIGTVQRYCDRAMLVRNGKIVKVGKSEDVVGEYMNENVVDEEARIRDDKKFSLENIKKRLNGLKGKELEMEKRIINEERKRLEIERKNKVAEITEIDFFDAEGNRKNVFDTRDDISIKISFVHNVKTEPLNFGFTIHSAENNYIFGINTFIDKIDTKRFAEREYLYLNFKAIPLKTTAYYVTVGIFGDNEGKVYDIVERAKSFRIISTCKSHGLFDLNYEWI